MLCSLEEVEDLECVSAALPLPTVVWGLGGVTGFGLSWILRVPGVPVITRNFDLLGRELDGPAPEVLGRWDAERCDEVLASEICDGAGCLIGRVPARSGPLAPCKAW